MNGEIGDVLKTSEEQMNKVIEATRGLRNRPHRRPICHSRTGTGGMLRLLTPLKQIAGISAPEPRLLVVQPWDKSIINDVEKPSKRRIWV